MLVYGPVGAILSPAFLASFRLNPASPQPHLAVVSNTRPSNITTPAMPAPFQRKLAALVGFTDIP